MKSTTRSKCFSGHTGPVLGIGISRDGRRAISGGDDRTVRLWDVDTGAQLHTFEGHAGQVMAVALSPDGRRAISGGQDSKMMVWDLTERRLVHAIEGQSGAWIRALAISNDGRMALSGSEDKLLCLWDLQDGRQIRQFGGFMGGKHKGSVTAIAFSPDCESALSGGRESGDIRLWDVQSGKERQRLRGHTAAVQSLAFFPDGRRAISSGCRPDATVRLWDLAVAQEVAINDGRIWDPATADKMYERDRSAENARLPTIEKFTLSVDGHRIISYHEHLDQLDLFDVDSGGHIARLEGHTKPAASVAFSVDGRRVISASWDRTIRLWEI